MMETYRIYAKDLEEDEVDYELTIRGYPLEGPLETRYRALRLALRQPEDEDAVLNTEYSLLGDFVVVPIKHKRVRRYVPDTDQQHRNQEELLDVIVRMVRKYYNVDLQTAADRVPVMRLETNPSEVVGATGGGVQPKISFLPSSSHRDAGELAAMAGAGMTGTPVRTRLSNVSLPAVETELISFSEDRPQGTPKETSRKESGSGAVRKQPPVSDTRRVGGDVFDLDKLSKPVGHEERGGVEDRSRMVTTPGAAAGRVPAGPVEFRNPFPPLRFDSQWETPEFKSNIPSNLLAPEQNPVGHERKAPVETQRLRSPSIPTKPMCKPSKSPE